MGFAVLARAALLVGFSKTAVSGADTVSLAIFAAVLPARSSTGVLLPVLIAGDVPAVLTCRRHAHWPTLWRLFPAVAVCVVAGILFSTGPTNAVMRSATGVILLLIPAVTVIRRRTAGRGNDKSDDRRGRTTRATGTTSAASDRGNGNDERGKNDTSDRNDDDDQDTVATRAGRFKARSHGVHGGFTTMVTNAGGPVTL